MLLYGSARQQNRLSGLPLWSWATYFVLELCIFASGFHQVINRNTGRFYFYFKGGGGGGVATILLQFADTTHLGVLLLGRALLIGTLWYIESSVPSGPFLIYSWASSQQMREDVTSPLICWKPCAAMDRKLGPALKYPCYIAARCSREQNYFS